MPAPIATLLAGLRRLGCTPAEALALGILALASTVCVGLLWLQARPAAPGAPGVLTGSEAPTESGIVITEAEVIVHVVGAVARPGVYTLAGGSRVGDAVTIAGGALPRAVLDGLNLARPLTDGEQVLVPDKTQAPAAAGGVPTGDAAGGATPSGAAPSGAAPGGGAVPVSLNTATLADLETLPGIGPVLAERIISHRDSIGGFTEVGELRDVSGIGEKTFQSLADLVSL